LVLYSITQTGLQTFYFKHTISSANIIFRGTSNAVFSIDNVSVKEVGQDWTLLEDVNIGNGVATFLDSGSNPNTRLIQSNILTSGKSYKLTFEVTRYVAGRIQVLFGGSPSIDLDISSGVGTYTIYGVSNGTDITIKRNGGFSNFDFDITNISVKEVGQNWTVTNGNISDKYNASMTAYQSGIKITPFVKTGTYKVVFDLVVTSGSCKFDAGGGNDEIYTTSGTKEILITNPTKFEFNAFNLGWVGSLDNVSVIQITNDTNLPRIDYTSGTGSLLLEPQSTNLLIYSEDFSQWGNARTTDTANQAISPDGTNNASFFEQQSGQTNAGSIFLSSLGLSSGTYTQSIFAKKKDKNFIVCYNANAERTYFNLSNGTIGTVAAGNTAKIEDYGNGWFRCAITYTITTGSVIAFYLADTDNSTTVTDSGGVYIWGAQLEQQSFATSYIPTEGSTVTRLADVCNNAGSSDLINSTEGVLYAEISALANDLTERRITISDGTTSNRVAIEYTLSSNQIKGRVVSSSSTSANMNFTASSIVDFSKIAISYKQNEFNLWINGTKVATDTSGNAPIGLNKISFDNGTGGNAFHGNVKTVAVFKEALSDTELQKLTTI